jgi:hypothetical protein
MTYDGELANRVRETLGRRSFAEKRMFGGLAFLLGGHMAVAVSGQGGLMVRVDRAQTAMLMSEPGVSEMEMKGRPVNGWLRVSAEVLDDAALGLWVDRAVTYVQTLPPK